MVNKIALTILIGIILTAIIVSLANVGTGLFLSEPEWDEFCGYSDEFSMFYKENMTKEICEGNNFTWVSQKRGCIEESCPQEYCDPLFNCQKKF